MADQSGTPEPPPCTKPGAGAVHFTSALRYPVFGDGGNYNGTPNMLRTPILRAMVDTLLAAEAAPAGAPARLLPSSPGHPEGPEAPSRVTNQLNPNIELARQADALWRADLSGADLSGAALRVADLSGANLSGGSTRSQHDLGGAAHQTSCAG
jgi:hypothetical protein